MKDKLKIHEILVKKNALEKDPGDTTLVCEMRDGTYRRVAAIFADGQENIDYEIWEVVRAKQLILKERKVPIFIQD